MPNCHKNTKTLWNISFCFLFYYQFATKINIYKEYIDIYLYHSYIIYIIYIIYIYIYDIYDIYMYIYIYTFILIYTVLYMKYYA